MIINSGKSFDLVYDFLDKNDIECTPETFNYKIFNDKTQDIIREGSMVVEEGETTLILPLTVEDNTVTESEKRRVAVEWTINGGEDGDSPVFTYNIEKV